MHVIIYIYIERERERERKENRVRTDIEALSLDTVLFSLGFFQMSHKYLSYQRWHIDLYES